MRHHKPTGHEEEGDMSFVNNLIVIAAAFASTSAYAQYTDGVIKIGVMADMSSLYSDISGPGSVVAARLAVEDFGAAARGMKVEIISADHQNKTDLASSIASSWFDVNKVDMILNGSSSGVGLALSEVARQKNKVYLATGPSISELTGTKRNANTIQWTFDTWNVAHSTANAMVRAGGDTWFFLTADYTFGHVLERDTTAVIEANGGRVLGRVRHPLNTNDFSSFLLQAQASRAKVIGLANAGGDTINAIKQASQFGIVRGGQTLAGLLVFAPDVAALGLQATQGLVFTETWYWDMNEANRAWTKRWQKDRAGKVPSMVQAGDYSGDYSAVIHYLKAIETLKNDADGKAVVAKMKEMPTDDPLFGKGYIRIDGRKMHDAYLFEAKKPEESKYPGDFYRLRATISAEEAFRPLKDGGCPLVNG
jgi:branched-chain amino acid transport system substrate-binding protein